jgi:hypothetical protein
MSYVLLDLLDHLLDYGMSQKGPSNLIGMIFGFLTWVIRENVPKTKDIIIVHPHSTIFGTRMKHKKDET